MDASLLSNAEPRDSQYLARDRALRGLYFLNGFSTDGVLRAGSLFFIWCQFSTQQIGIAEAMIPWAQAFGGQTLGPLADVLRQRKLLFMCVQTISSLTMVSLSLKALHESFAMTAAVSCVVGLFNIGGPTFAAYTIDHLGTERKSEYGTFRLFNAISWGLGAIYIGLMDKFAGFDWVLYTYAALQVPVLLLVGIFLPRHNSSVPTDAAAGTATPRASVRVLCHALIRPRVLYFLFYAVALGMLVGCVERLLFAYVTYELHGPPHLCGFAVGCMVVFEIPIFLYGSTLLKRYAASEKQRAQHEHPTPVRTTTNGTVSSDPSLPRLQVRS